MRESRTFRLRIPSRGNKECCLRGLSCCFSSFFFPTKPKNGGREGGKSTFVQSESAEFWPNFGRFSLINREWAWRAEWEEDPRKRPILIDNLSFPFPFPPTTLLLLQIPKRKKEIAWSNKSIAGRSFEVASFSSRFLSMQFSFVSLLPPRPLGVPSLWQEASNCQLRRRLLECLAWKPLRNKRC